MRPLLFWVSKENQYEYNETLKMHIKITVFDENKKDI